MGIKRFIFLCACILSLSIPNIVCAQNYGDLDTGFRFMLYRSETDPIGVVARLASTTEYPCKGYRLRTKVTHQRDTVTISILGMSQPVPCFPLHAKSTGSAFLGNKVAGKYFLRFLYRGVTDVYRLTFESGRSILTPVKKTLFTEQRPASYFDEE